jgi:hypothetical protein
MGLIEAMGRPNYSNAPTLGDTGPTTSGRNQRPKPTNTNTLAPRLQGARSNKAGGATGRRDLGTPPNVSIVIARVSKKACVSAREIIPNRGRLRSLSECDERMSGSDDSICDSYGDSPSPSSGSDEELRSASYEEHFEMADNMFERLSALKAKLHDSIFSTTSSTPALEAALSHNGFRLPKGWSDAQLPDWVKRALNEKRSHATRPLPPASRDLKESKNASGINSKKVNYPPAIKFEVKFPGQPKSSVDTANAIQKRKPTAVVRSREVADSKNLSVNKI